MVFESSIKSILIFVFLASLSLIPSHALAEDAWIDCINNHKAPFIECHHLIKIQNLKTLDQSLTEIAEQSYSYTLDLGLGEPVFGSLKRSRDRFISKHITSNIAKIEVIRDNNMRKLNLKSAYNSIVSPDSNDLITTLKSLFGLESLASTFASIKTSRKESCDNKYNDKKANCESITDYREKSRCLSEAQAIKSNCFKFTTNVNLFSNITDLLNEYEKELLDAVDSVSLVDTDGFKSIRETLSSTTQAIDTKTAELNKVVSLDIDGKLGHYLEGNVYELLERKIAKIIGADESLLGPGTYANMQSDNELLNFNKDFSGSINTSGNLCNLTKCLMFPKSKRNSQQYKDTCVAAGLSEGDLNETINHVRRKLTNFAAQLALQKLIIEMPIQEHLKSLRTSLICSQVATLNVLQDKVVSAASPGLTTANIASFTNTSGSSSSTPAIENASSKSVYQCVKENNAQASEGSKTSDGGSLNKAAGPIETFLAFTTQFNLPYLSAIEVQAGVEKEIKLNAPRAIDYCLARGKSQSWVDNFNECKSDSASLTSAINVNASIGKLIIAQRSWAKAECKSNLNFQPKVFNFTSSSAKSNPQLEQDPLSPNNERWDELTDALISAKQTLHKAKLKPFLIPTKQAICANNLLEIIRKQSNNIYTDSTYSCQISDFTPPPNVINASDVVIDDMQLGSTNSLIPSIIKLCIDSAENVSNHPNLSSPIDDYLMTLGTGITRDNIPNDDIFNPANAFNQSDDYEITRSISNIKFCDSFFTEVIGLTFPIKVNKDSLSNQNILRNELLKNQKNMAYNEMSVLDKANQDYHETLTMLDGLSSTEAFNLCVKRSKYRELLYRKRTPIDQAVLNWCRVYKTNKFDVYYNDAKKSFNYPVSTESGRQKIDEEILIRDRRFRDGSI